LAEKETDQKQKGFEVKTFTVPFVLAEIKENLIINTNTSSKPSKEQIINQAFKFHSQGKTSEAAKLYQYCINQGFTDYRVFSNYGTILSTLGKSQDAEVFTRQAIELNPDYYLVLPWHFKEEFIKREKEFIRRGGKLIFPLPELEIYPYK